MNYLRPMALAAALVAPIFLSGADKASASPLIAAASVKAPAQSTSSAPVIEIEANSIKIAPGIYVGPRSSTNTYHRNLGAVPNHRRVYRKKHRRRYNNHGVYLNGYPYFYHQPQYHYTPPVRYGLSCGEILSMLHSQGYRHIQTYDCTGKVYTFFAYHGRRHYKLRVYSRNGSFKSRKRI